MDTQPLEKPRSGQRIAVVILNWNGEKLLREFLPQVIAATDSAISRIIVADNGSTDGSLEYLDTLGDVVGIIRFDKNYGFAEGYNRAIAAVADFQYSVLLNSDATGTPGWDAALLGYMDNHPEVAACQPKLLAYRMPDTFEYAGAAGGMIDRNGYPYCRGRIFATCEKDTGQYDLTPEYIFWASGACLMVRTHLYNEVGGLDAAFFAHMEEIDLCWRLQLAGYRIAVVTSAIALHLGGGSLPAENPRKTYLNFRNNLLMMHKNLPEASRSRKLLWRRLLDTIAWAKYALTLDFANAAAIWHAHRDFAHMSSGYNAHPDTDLLADKAKPNILVQYYLLGRHRFSELKRPRR